MKLRSLVPLTCLGLGGAALPLIVDAQGGAMFSKPLVTAAAPRAHSNQCVPPAVATKVRACTGDSGPTGAQTTGKAPRSRVRTMQRTQQATKRGPTAPGIVLDVATRRNREAVQARSWQLLQREVQVLNRLVGNTRTDDPRRPDILLRLAETYFEMEQPINARVRSFDDPISDALGHRNAARVRELRGKQREAENQLKSVRLEAIRTYATLVRDHPNYRRLDEVYFSLAFGLEQMQKFEEAREAYKRLIKEFPQSPFVPHAWLSFAEYYFAQGDMQAALKFYQKVLEFPPDRNRVYGFAIYKSAWCHYNLEDYQKSLEKFVEVLEYVTQHPDSRDAENLARQSRRELVIPYAMVGSPQRALQFFSRYATNRQQALEMLESLAELYFDTGQWPNTIAVYHQLMAESPQSDKLCVWQTKVTNAVISSKPKPEQTREIQRMVDVFEAFDNQGRHPEDSVRECKQSAASTLVWLATAWHREAVGSEDSPGTGDKDTMNQAAQLYRLIVEKFPDMAQMEFPDIDRRDWPTAYRIAYYYAELLWKMEDWGQCGPAFDHVVELDPRGEFTADAAHAAVLCYDKLYQQQYQHREKEVRSEVQQETRGGRRGRRGAQQAATEEQKKIEPREFTVAERGMLRAFDRYVCFVAAGEDLPTIKYRRARIFYEANRFEESALMFREVAWEHKDTELGPYAANLYLDSLILVSEQFADREAQCLSEVSDSIEPLWGFYCNSDEKKQANDHLCNRVGQLTCDVLRKGAEAYEKEEQWSKAAANYVKIYRQHRECGRLDEVLYNAAIDFEAARLIGNAIRVRNVLIREFPASEWGKRAVYLVGANYHAIAMYEDAAKYYEQFAQQFGGEEGQTCTDAERRAGTCAIAHEALMNAIFFRLGLGQENEAIEDARLFQKNYRRKLPQQSAQANFSLGTIYERHEDWEKVVEHYQQFLKQYRRDAKPNQVVRANVQIGKAYWNGRDRNRAEDPFRDALRAYQGAAEAINRSQGSDEEKNHDLFDAKDAASEAFFYLAEYKFALFQRIHFPSYHGGRNLDRVNKWTQRELKPWFDEKRRALQAAEVEYNKIAELQVPSWQIAAAARVGSMYKTFMDELHEAPIPEEIVDDEELYGIYVDALESLLGPLRTQATEKFEFCLITSTRVRWFSDWSRQCERELNTLNPREYPMAAELRDGPSYMFHTVGLPRPVELGSNDEEAMEAAGGQQGEEQ